MKKLSKLHFKYLNKFFQNLLNKYLFPVFTWPWAGTNIASTSVSYGFLGPGGIYVPGTTTTTEATTTTTTTAAPESAFNLTHLLITALLSGGLFSRPPVVTGVAQPLPSVVSPPVIGGPSGIGVIGGTGQGGFFLPPGFPAGGGLLASGILPGFLPRARSAKGYDGKENSKTNEKRKSGKIIFPN